MKTPAIANPVNFISDAASASKQSSASADVPFSQVLSREMAGQPKASEPVAANPATNSQGTQAAQAQAKPAEAHAPEESEKSETTSAAQGDQTNAASPNKSDRVAEAKTTNVGVASIKAKNKADDADQDEDASPLDASAELLALVANLVQPATVPAQSSQKHADDGKQAGQQAGEHAADTATQLAVQLKDPAAPDARFLNVPVPLLPQATGQLQDAAVPTEAGARIFDPALAVPRAGVLRRQAQASAIPTTDSAKKAEPGAEQAAAPHTDAAQQVKAHHAEPDIAGKGETSDPKQSDAKLAQAKDEKPALKINRDTPPSTHADPATMPTQGAKAASPETPSGAAPINIAGLPAATHLQAAQAVTSPASAAANVLTPRVGSTGWDQSLGQKVVWMVGNEQQSASLTLNPPDLGPLQVVVHVSDNQASANFVAAQPEVRNAIEAAMPKLREMLGEAGIQLGQANVSAGTPNQQQNAFSAPQQPSRQSGGETNDSLDAPARVVRTQIISEGRGLVDTFA